LVERLVNLFNKINELPLPPTKVRKGKKERKKKGCEQRALTPVREGTASKLKYGAIDATKKKKKGKEGGGGLTAAEV